MKRKPKTYTKQTLKRRLKTFLKYRYLDYYRIAAERTIKNFIDSL